jgi:hypothetical protein
MSIKCPPREISTKVRPISKNRKFPWGIRQTSGFPWVTMPRLCPLWMQKTTLMLKCRAPRPLLGAPYPQRRGWEGGGGTDPLCRESQDNFEMAEAGIFPRQFLSSILRSELLGDALWGFEKGEMLQLFEATKWHLTHRFGLRPAFRGGFLHAPSARRPSFSNKDGDRNCNPRVQKKMLRQPMGNPLPFERGSDNQNWTAAPPRKKTCATPKR